MESQPDADRAVRIDLQRAVALDIAELRRTGIIECEHDGR
jgi:hypothetical protein